MTFFLYLQVNEEAPLYFTVNLSTADLFGKKLHAITYHHRYVFSLRTAYSRVVELTSLHLVNKHETS